MQQWPIFLFTHPRACSTAFERIFMNHPDFVCFHEPFEDAFHFGPERINDRFVGDEHERRRRKYGQLTYAAVWNDIEKALEPEGDGKRVFIKGMARGIMPLNGGEAHVVPSLSSMQDLDNGIEPTNITVLPTVILQRFHLTFLIRNPRLSVPSIYKYTTPPMSDLTGWSYFSPTDIGIREVRRLFDWARAAGVGVDRNSEIESLSGITGVGTRKLVVVDAEELLADPTAITKAYCQAVNARYDDAVLNWGSDENHGEAEKLFKKWGAFHDVALESKTLHPPNKDMTSISREEELQNWISRYGEKGAREIRRCVDENMEDYLYLKQFRLQP